MSAAQLAEAVELLIILKHDPDKLCQSYLKRCGVVKCCLLCLLFETEERLS